MSFRIEHVMVLRTLSNVFKLRGCIYDILRGQGFEQKNYQKLQGERLKILVKHAYENVDLYRKKYDEVGVKPEDIKSVEDIHKLPIITKDDLRANFPHGILAKNIDAKDCVIVSTAGTTGKPVKLYKKRYKNSDLLKYAPLAFMLLPKILKARVGKKIRRRTMYIVAMDEECVSYSFFRRVQRVPRFLRGELHIVSALDDPQVHLQALQKYQPDIIITYPSVLRNIAIFSRQEGLTVPQPKLLIVGGELMDEPTRKAISDTFKGELIEEYAVTEAGTIALSCPNSRSLHIICVSCVLEVLKDGKPAPPGVPGNVVVTDLWNMASPIIRYSGLDDLVVLSDTKCSCGNKLPFLKVIEGRTVDSFILPDNRMITPGRLIFALAHIPQIAYYQIIQDEIDKVRILVVAEESEFQEAPSPFGEGEPLWSMIMDNFKKLLGEDVHIAIDLVKDIPRPPGSRFYAVVRSLVEKPSYWEPV